jgi:hypothetical protein
MPLSTIFQLYRGIYNNSLTISFRYQPETGWLHNPILILHKDMYLIES